MRPRGRAGRTHAPLPPLRLGAPTFPGAFGDGSADADTTAARSGQKQGLADGGRDHRGSPVFPWTRQNLIPGFRWDPGRTSVPRFVRAILPVRNRPPSMVQTGWPPWVCLSSLPRRNSAAIACACKCLGLARLCFHIRVANLARAGEQGRHPRRGNRLIKTFASGSEWLRTSSRVVAGARVCRSPELLGGVILVYVCGVGRKA